ncbi:ribonuclease J [Salsipaludibacter albus]|uniref:ribonuclease J n=1 Tax=Salsipaludibacter albus TaxID=2849650 RepID=UPI001EE3F0EC|nr:ribonuclease J [Salsipaludibacter albus]MBY5163493.1 ribonuclease J [Salsipaludibacter albus]
MTTDANGLDRGGVTVTFLGGLGEIGRNMATLTCEGETVVIDVGVFFPNPEHLGVDLITPDWQVLEDENVTAVFLTHGHLDHIGALPYFLRDFPDVTVYGTRLTLAFVEAILSEWDDLDDPEMVEVAPTDIVDHGPFQVEVVQVSHSIPDGCAFAITTDHGTIVHTGDFKLDQTPIDDLPTDLAHFARLGDVGVDLLLADSTNAHLPGHVPTERTVGATLLEEIRGAEGLVVVASFASHVHRIQQVLDAAAEVGRRHVFVGRSMVKNMAIARELGYLRVDADNEIELKDVDRYPRDEVIVISTGSQGEPYSALSLMAAGDHRRVDVGEGDLVILASSLIPGNEHAVFRSINGLARRGARVVHKGLADVHVSGHAMRDDLVLFHNIVEPEYVVPVHGEFRHMAAHRDVAIASGCPPEQAMVCSDGDTVVLRDGVVTRGDRVPSGQVYIDGLLPDVGPAVLRHRRRLAEDGVVVAVVTVDTSAGELVGDVLVQQHGVVYEDESAHVLDDAIKAVHAELADMPDARWRDLDAVRRHVIQALGRFWRHEVGRRPFIMPIVLEA